MESRTEVTSYWQNACADNYKAFAGRQNPFTESTDTRSTALNLYSTPGLENRQSTFQYHAAYQLLLTAFSIQRQISKITIHMRRGRLPPGQMPYPAARISDSMIPRSDGTLSLTIIHTFSMYVNTYTDDNHAVHDMATSGQGQYPLGEFFEPSSDTLFVALEYDGQMVKPFPAPDHSRHSDDYVYIGKWGLAWDIPDVYPDAIEDALATKDVCREIIEMPDLHD